MADGRNGLPVAESALRQALALASDKLDAYLRMGDLFRYQKQYEEAVAWYQQARVVVPEHYAPPYYLGLVSCAQKRTEPQITQMTQIEEEGIG